LLAGNAANVVTELQKGLAPAGHTAFVDHLEGTIDDSYQ